jgi:hypothetical protein
VRSCLVDVAVEILTAVDMKNSVFWDVLPCSPVKVNQCFGGIYCLHLQGLRVSQPRNQYETGSKMLYLFFDPEDGGDIFLQNVG